MGNKFSSKSKKEDKRQLIESELQNFSSYDNDQELQDLEEKLTKKITETKREVSRYNDDMAQIGNVTMGIPGALDIGGLAQVVNYHRSLPKKDRDKKPKRFSFSRLLTKDNRFGSVSVEKERDAGDKLPQRKKNVNNIEIGIPGALQMGGLFQTNNFHEGNMIKTEQDRKTEKHTVHPSSRASTLRRGLRSLIGREKKEDEDNLLQR
jgi:hypothetical protein